MFYSLGNNLEKTSRGIPPPTPPCVRPWFKVTDTEQPFIETTSPFTSKLLFRLQEEKFKGSNVSRPNDAD